MSTRKVVCNYVMQANEQLIAERVQKLNSLGLEATRQSVAETAMQVFCANPEMQATAEAVIADFRSNRNDIPAGVTDDDLRVNAALVMYFDDLAGNLIP